MAMQRSSMTQLRLLGREFGYRTGTGTYPAHDDVDVVVVTRCKEWLESLATEMKANTT